MILGIIIGFVLGCIFGGAVIAWLKREKTAVESAIEKNVP